MTSASPPPSFKCLTLWPLTSSDNFCRNSFLKTRKSFKIHEHGVLTDVFYVVELNQKISSSSCWPQISFQPSNYQTYLLKKLTDFKTREPEVHKVELVLGFLVPRKCIIKLFQFKLLLGVQFHHILELK